MRKGQALGWLALPPTILNWEPTNSLIFSFFISVSVESTINGAFSIGTSCISLTIFPSTLVLGSFCFAVEFCKLPTRVSPKRLLEIKLSWSLTTVVPQDSEGHLTKMTLFEHEEITLISPLCVWDKYRPWYSPEGIDSIWMFGCSLWICKFKFVCQAVN